MKIKDRVEQLAEDIEKIKRLYPPDAPMYICRIPETWMQIEAEYKPLLPEGMIRGNLCEVLSL